MSYNYNRSEKLNRNNRPDHQKGHRMEFERNRKKVLASEDICAICGQRVDKKLKYPHPMSATVDHVIPVSKGGHPSDISNLQLAHFYCNRQKSDTVCMELMKREEKDRTTRKDLLEVCRSIEDYDKPIINLSAFVKSSLDNYFSRKIYVYQPKKNSFHNFQQRNYDFEELEKVLLSN